MEFKHHTKIQAQAIADVAQKLTDYQNTLVADLNDFSYGSPENSINLPFDTNYQKDLSKTYERIAHNPVKYIVLIGIGGSDLGVKAVYDGLYGATDTHTHTRYPKMLFVESIEPELLNAHIHFLKGITDPDEVLFIAVSKSGATLETIVNLEILATQIPYLTKRLIVVSQKESNLYHESQRHGIVSVDIPTNVSGRYSVFSSVGILPLHAMGDDTLKDLLRGARDITNNCLDGNPSRNPALLSAIIQYLLNQQGFIIHENFFFKPQLESLGKWTRQLVAETLGKEHDREGQEIRINLTPTVAIGTNDLHSMTQLHLGGTLNKMITFLYTEEANSEVVVPSHPFFENVVDHIHGKSVNQLFSSVFRAVESAYNEAEIPTMMVSLKTNSAYEIGAYMQMKMIETMYLARLFNVDAFNQPHVEIYKEEARHLIAQLPTEIS